MVLICDGDVNYYQSTIDKCVAGGIQIYAVNVWNTSTHTILQKMTDQTGGQYYYASTADQLETVFASVVGDTIDQIDPTDADGDGLYDIFETAGMKLPNGRIIYTDPANPDLDGDGLTDDVDDRPLMPELVQVAKLNSKFSDYYFNVVGDDGNTCYGGNQNWWEDKARFEGSSEGLIGQEKLRYDQYFRLWKMGCGTIAMSDAELYMAIQNSGYSLSVDSPFDADFQQTGLCKKKAYMDYVEKQYGKKYAILGDSLSINVGIYPGQMESGFRKFLSANGNSSTKVKWARYNHESYIDQKRKIVDDIESMLKKDIPVVFAYHTFVGEGIGLYISSGNAKEKTESKDDGSASSHYMTIVGLYKYAGDQPMQDKYILEVVSWGQVYYIDYDAYSEKLSSFSNILSVY